MTVEWENTDQSGSRRIKVGGKTHCIFSRLPMAHGISNALNGVSILLIRITSPWYHTANSISTGNTLPQILRSFPGARTIDQSQTLYDDVEQGIAFEFAGRATAGSPCTAIMVHPPGKVNLTTAKDVNEILRANGIL